MPPLLQLTAIRKAFGGVQALRGVSFDLQPGEIHALVGENGAGKSTLIKIVTGAHQPDEGTLEVAGQVVTANDPTRARDLGISAIYQQPALFPDLTVAENLALGLEPPGGWRRVRWGQRRERARKLLGRVGSAIDPDTEARRLTMPEQQLVEIARALGADARILILDEPTASLSDREVDQLFGVLRQLRGQGVGILYVSHRLEELARIADRVTALRDGAVVGTRPMPEVTRADLIRLMVGRELAAVFPKVAATPGAVVLETRGLGCRAAGVRGIDLSVRAGEILGLAGLVGAGRTELARVLFGLTPADEGTILLDGRAVALGSPQQAAALGIAYVPEDRRRHGVILDLPVAANVTLATLRQVAQAGFLRFGQEAAVAADYVARLGIKTPSVATPVGNLSGGNQQKVALARWLGTSPRVLVLDEPTQGVDVGAKAEIHRLMSDLAGQGIAIVMISSELPEILGMSDRIAVMHAGTVTGVLDRAGATQEQILELALSSAERGTRSAEPQKGSESSALRVPRSALHKYRRELSVTAALLTLLGVLAVAAPDFFRADQLRALLVAKAPVLVCAVGMTLVILARHIDISVGAQFSICGILAAWLAREGVALPAVLLATLATGAALGALNGLLVAWLELPAIVVTLATLAVLREGLRWGREGEAVTNLPAAFQWFGQGQGQGQGLIVAVAALVFLGCAWGVRHLAAGRAVYATGSDQEAARLAGVRPRRVVFGVFVVMGLLAAVAALLNAVRFASADPNAGNGLELEVIAAVVVGGTAVSGGRGTLAGTLAGVALLGSIGTALVFLHTPAEWEKALQGLIILVAVASDALERRAA